MEKIFKKIRQIEILEYALLVMGCLIISLSFNLFLYPNEIASGGLPGLSVVLYKFLGIHVAYIQWGINAPLFLFGILKHGKDFGLKTVIGSFSIPMFILLTKQFPAMSFNLLIASVIGGIGSGIGLGLVFKSKGTVGGFSLAARLLHDYTSMKISTLLMMLNGIVIMLAGLVFGFSGAIYALLSLAITCLVIEAINII